MSVDSVLPIFIFLIFALVVGSFVCKMFKLGGFKAAMFGSPIERQVGEVSGSGAKMMSVGLKVHKLNGGFENAVGVEVVAKSMASYQLMPVTLSASEARQLIALLEEAAEGRDPLPPA